MYAVSKMLFMFTGIGCMITPDYLQARVSLDQGGLFVDNLMPSEPAISSLLLRRGITWSLAINPYLPSSLLPEEAMTPVASMTPEEQATCTEISVISSSDQKEEVD